MVLSWKCCNSRISRNAAFESLDTKARSNSYLKLISLPPSQENPLTDSKSYIIKIHNSWCKKPKTGIMRGTTLQCGTFDLKPQMKKITCGSDFRKLRNFWDFIHTSIFSQYRIPRNVNYRDPRTKTGWSRTERFDPGLRYGPGPAKKWTFGPDRIPGELALI